MIIMRQVSYLLTMFRQTPDQTIQVKINKRFSIKLKIFSYPSILTYVLSAQKNRLIETVLLSTHNICFG